MYNKDIEPGPLTVIFDVATGEAQLLMCHLKLRLKSNKTPRYLSSVTISICSPLMQMFTSGVCSLVLEKNMPFVFPTFKVRVLFHNISLDVSLWDVCLAAALRGIRRISW